MQSVEENVRMGLGVRITTGERRENDFNVRVRVRVRIATYGVRRSKPRPESGAERGGELENGFGGQDCNRGEA